ncbi:MAG: helix-turn-helix domain-containing protein [Candidatus Dormibacteria bacterium]|jgi:AcrR family transcriptional regulator|nr:hypothetical protein [Chloroflexota bacterium]HBV93774.1 hypothetical protein [Chloroflexota bacterium]
MASTGTDAAAAGAARRQAARARILVAARRSLSSGGLPPFAELAREAGVSRATLYRCIPSRGELFRLLEVEPDPSARDRVLEEAVTLFGQRGLAALSMEELAARAGISRASLYRLFPGKPALFREVVRAHSPFIPVARAIAEHAGEPPERVMPVLAREIVRSTWGRTGLFRVLLLEISGPDADAELARELALSETIGPLVAYVAGQMESGWLRRMDPRIALIAFVGPLVMHLITRDLAERALGLDIPVETTAQELAAVWLRAMRPEAAAVEAGASGGHQGPR